jgi:hypothetical protein
MYIKKGHITKKSKKFLNLLFFLELKIKKTKAEIMLGPNSMYSKSKEVWFINFIDIVQFNIKVPKGHIRPNKIK